MQYTEEKAMRSESVIDTSDEYLKSEIEYFKQQLKNENLDEESRASFQTQLEEYELYLKYDIKLYGNTWKNDTVRKYVEFKQNGKNDEAEKLIKILKENAHLLVAPFYFDTAIIDSYNLSNFENYNYLN